MNKGIITLKSCKFNDYIHHVDLKEFGTNRILSAFIAEFDDQTLFLDCGSSIEEKRLIRYSKKHNIPLSSVNYLVTSHHHFDHTGGMWKLYDRIKRINPDVKIITNRQTKNLLNDYEFHLNRAKRTFGNFIGEMKPIEEKAFELVEPEDNFHKNVKSIGILKEFRLRDEMIKFAILKTPGHTPDHQCPLFIKNGKIDFIYLGEAIGTLYHSTELLTMPTSMPVFFNYDSYMDTLSKLKRLEPLNAGFCHFGIVSGKNNIKALITEHETFMKEFKERIIEAYEEKPETRYVFDKIMPFLTPRTDLVGKDHPIMQNIVLGVVYGMLMDLGYRNK
ncbi:MAG: MBL fold metallo-hydrolase [Candidatus Lokiarchaeota archaeon]|nr:MBL fold metallo-hydrolase [Candidatus Lokiarchaeota archaeon]MBD3342666.1 MBL fold metallo-hydrolase [Candidatus Lokiarchaeota archaeon]